MIEDEVYEDLMQVVLLAWEEFYPNHLIANGVQRFIDQMQTWVDKERHV